MIKLEVKASDPDDDLLTYRYLVSGGRIIGKGPHVGWDLRKALGPQKVRVEVSDRHGGKSFSVVVINVRPSGVCDFPCSTITVSCPNQITEGQVVAFVANVSGSGPDRKLGYSWSVTNGRVVGGRQKRKVLIQATGSLGDEVTATVNVRGLDPACSYQASCASRIEKRALQPF